MWFPVKIVKDAVSLTGKVRPGEMEAILNASALAKEVGLCEDNQLSYVAFCIMFTTKMINDTIADVDFNTQELLDDATA
jgi:hypothetical protein